SWSRGGPNTWGPGNCMAPNPTRWTVKDPRANVDAPMSTPLVSNYIASNNMRANKRLSTGVARDGLDEAVGELRQQLGQSVLFFGRQAGEHAVGGLGVIGQP